MGSLWSVVALVLAVGSVVGAVLYARQVRTRERQAVASAEAAKELKNEFVAMVSHELRTPLTSIAGFTDTLVDSWQELAAEEVDEFLSIIAKQARYLGDLVEDILVIPRLEAGRLRLEPEMFDLTSLVHHVVDLLFPQGTRRDASVAIPGGVRVYADAQRVQQVLRNLLDNARKYGGDQVLIEGLSYGENYVLVVSDNGAGVPPESVGRIFEHFEQMSKGDARSSTGVGLGLPIARKLARAMSGDVWYEKRFPRGSRFCFSMALIPPVEQLTGEVRQTVRSSAG